MAINVGDAILKITGDSTDLDKELKSVDGKVKSATDNMSKNMRIAGAAMTGMGVAIVGVLGMATKAAIEEEAGIQKLRTAMQGAGLSYDDNRESLEKLITAQQNSTAFADDEQREALSMLIPLTGDLTTSQNLLATAMDLARWKDMDLVSAAEILGKVQGGNLGILSRYGIVLKEGATTTEALAEIQKLAAGQAEAYGKTAAGQMDALQARIGDLKESIGAALIPMLTNIVEKIKPIIDKIIDWGEKNPKLAQTIIMITAILGGLMMVLGPILMVLPGIIAAVPILGAVFAALTGPIGLAIAAVVALIAIGVLLHKNWDKIKEGMAAVWEGIKGIFRGGIVALENAINWIINKINSISFNVPAWVPLIGGKTFGFNIPKVTLPSFEGFEGIIPGIPGTPIPAMVHAGEYIGQVPSNTVNIYNPVVRSDDDIEKLTRQVEQVMYRHQRLRYV